MKKIFIFLSIFVVLLVFSFKTNAETVLFSEGWPNSYVNLGGTPIGLEGWGYGKPYFSNFTTMADNIIGQNNINVVHDFENTSLVMSYDALWVDLRDYHDTLSALEISNIQAFATTGKKVVMIGEHDNWADWSNSILSVVGSSVGGNFSNGDYTQSIVQHEITNNISGLKTWGSGLAIGGTPLFSENIITLWGNSNNILTILDDGMFDDNGWYTYLDKQQLASNTLNWVKNSSPIVPEPRQAGFTPTLKAILSTVIELPSGSLNLCEGITTIRYSILMIGYLERLKGIVLKILLQNG